MQESGALTLRIEMAGQRPNAPVHGRAAPGRSPESPRREAGWGIALYRTGVTLLVLCAIAASLPMFSGRAAVQTERAQSTSAASLAPITIDYPQDGSILPPEITPPTFIWHDGAKDATY